MMENCGFVIWKRVSATFELNCQILFVPFFPQLELGIAIHCGGWDAITGGQCTHAWAIMTGCREQYIILRNPQTGKWHCRARYNPHERKWLRHENNIHKCDNVTGVWVSQVYS